MRRTAIVRAHTLIDFEQNVLSGLALCGIDARAVTKMTPLGVAVSGGADSVSLLCALVAIFGAEPLCVLTVNHNLRAEAETSGDARFVESLCARLGVRCKRVDFARGAVTRCAEERGRGVEEAARFLRYRAFDDFIADENLCALCLAHNQNDMLETLLMRFLQGSGTEGGFGIARRRGRVVRPLLDVSREAIEAYLRARGQDWRTDATNDDARYLRNNIRKYLVPLLDDRFAGWKTALASGAEKAYDDNEAVRALCEGHRWERDGDAVWMDAAAFCALPRAVRRRLLFAACDTVCGGSRVPYYVVRKVLDWTANKKQTICTADAEISLVSAKIIVKKRQNKATESGFLAIIKEDNGSVHLVRSVQSGDCIRAKDGSLKSVQKIFGDWKVPADDRNRIPLVQDVSQAGQPIVAILGAELGYSDWMV